MGSTGEADRKRRHFSSISPTAATAKKHPFVPLSEENKLDAAVLQFQNQKLVQKLETQKVEISALEGRLCQLKHKQLSYDKTLFLVSNSWEELVDDLESRSNRMMDFVKQGQGFECQIDRDDGDSPPEDAFLSRLLETGASESSSASTTASQPEDDRHIDGEKAKKSKNIICSIVASFHDLNDLKDRLYAASLKSLPSNVEQSQKVISSDLQNKVKNLRMEVANLHLKHKFQAGELQSHRDMDAKNKADLKSLKGELESAIAELEESDRSLAILKAEIFIAKESFSPILNLGSKQVTSDKARDKQRDLQDMESTLKELLGQSTSWLYELKRLHEDRLDILKQLSTSQSNLKNVEGIFSSQSYLLLKDQLAKAKADLIHYQALFEKLQVGKESLFCGEEESLMKNELIDVLHRSSAVADSRISELKREIQRYTKERDLIGIKLEEASKEPGRKEIIAEFKALVSSFPEKMGSMQNQLAKYKETAANIYCMRANVHSLTNILDRKVKELGTLSSRTAKQNAEIQKLQALVHDLEVTGTDLKLFLDMYELVSTDAREVSETKISEIWAWAHVQSLKSCLDEHKLEVQVKVAIEAEAKAQQRLAATEADIAYLRQKLDASKREKARLSDVRKFKHEETEAYLSEIETIGLAYDDMRTQNQLLLQQITERDDYDIKLVLDGVKARQMGDDLLLKKRTLEKVVDHTKTTVGLYDLKAGRIEDQLKSYADHAQRLAESRVHNTAAGEDSKIRLLDVKKSSQQLMDTLEEAQFEVDNDRVYHAQLQIELEKERFERKRVEEDLETLRRKVQQLKSQVEGCSIVGKLQQELRKYKEILKCSVCLDRRKEVVITKCYHLFCDPCVQNIIETQRHRKCPVCAASFGVNDVKTIYI